ncbi:MAG TPA: DUF3866 family protein, partial [Actinotalea sp.]|nr:DUF3866 family protein [Actinotalea sp.]
MISWRVGTVVGLGRRWAGAVELEVRVTGHAQPEAAEGALVRALAHPPLVGEPALGDRVLLNVSALRRGLGTGGYALVTAIPDRLPPDPPPGPGHLVKA